MLRKLSFLFSSFLHIISPFFLGLGGQLLAVFLPNNEQLGNMLSELTKELEELEMDLTEESLRWTSTTGEEVAETVTIGWDGKEWEVPFVRRFEILGYRFRRDGKGSEGGTRLAKRFRSWWRDRLIYSARDEPLKVVRM